MKKLFSFCLLCLFAVSAMAQSNYVDLGLPSGTLWKSTNESRFYTYAEAIDAFGDQLPKKFHFLELIEICDWIWIDDYGYKVVGPNGNSIILPASGYRSCDGNGAVTDVGTYCDYWSSTPYDSESMWSLYFYSDKIKMFGALLCGGRSVRLIQEYNAHTWVDLGLSVKWATCNVGAAKPEDYGDYFAWGETEPKSTYDWSTYKYCNGSSTSLTKYCTDSYYGTVDNKTQLELSDDAARVNWGGSWRMPTKAERDELLANCSWTWVCQNGVYGYRVTSKKPGYTHKSIFLPVAGFCDGSSLYRAGSSGYYWSSSLRTGHLSSAYGLYFYSDKVYRDYSSRCFGRSVRPVCQ